jgi:hypothetical protein
MVVVHPPLRGGLKVVAPAARAREGSGAMGDRARIDTTGSVGKKQIPRCARDDKVSS